MCFFAGANSIFSGDKLLTTPNNEKNEDQKMFDLLGLVPKPANLDQGSDNHACKSQAQTAQPQPSL